VPHAHLHIIPRRTDDGIVLPTESVAYESPEQKAEILAKAKARLAP
jgi:diadenosine tetraphosphate (Ap4A) HIT family hydrolase